MNKVSTIAWGFAIALLITGCSNTIRRRSRHCRQPVNCDTAEGDIRVLQSEKTNAPQQGTAGVTSIAPAGIVIGLLKVTTKTRLRVATGQYNRMIDRKN
jgi:hypothetical protein